MLKSKVNFAFEIPTRNGYQKFEMQTHSLNKVAGSVIVAGFRSDSLRDPVCSAILRATGTTQRTIT